MGEGMMMDSVENNNGGARDSFLALFRIKSYHWLQQVLACWQIKVRQFYSSILLPLLEISKLTHLIGLNHRSFSLILDMCRSTFVRIFVMGSIR